MIDEENIFIVLENGKKGDWIKMQYFHMPENAYVCATVDCDVFKGDRVACISPGHVYPVAEVEI